jgi:hypothetical protein
MVETVQARRGETVNTYSLAVELVGALAYPLLYHGQHPCGCRIAMRSQRDYRVGILLLN